MEPSENSGHLCLPALDRCSFGVALSSNEDFQVRAFDATTVKEPGKTGSLWRIHYSVSLPSLSCDFFKLTETEGVGTGESFTQFAIDEGDYILADRGYSTANGIHHATARKSFVTVRVNTAALPLQDRSYERFPNHYVPWYVPLNYLDIHRAKRFRLKIRCIRDRKKMS